MTLLFIVSCHQLRLLATPTRLNKPSVFSCRMNPSQMTVRSHAQGHYYITSTLLHHCTECFSMNNTETWEAGVHGHGTWWLNDTDDKDRSYVKHELIRTVNNHISLMNWFNFISLIDKSVTQTYSYTHTSHVWALGSPYLNYRSRYRRLQWEMAAVWPVPDCEGRQGYRLLFFPPHETAGFSIEGKWHIAPWDHQTGPLS